MPQDTEPAIEWLTTQAAQALSGYHPDHLRRLARSGDVRARKDVEFGVFWQYDRADLERYMAEVRPGPKRGEASQR